MLEKHLSDTSDSDIPGDEPAPGNGGGLGSDGTSGGTPTPPEKDVSPITIEDEMRRSYLDYAMSVIMSRALPDARDGLKPVHRRILFSMSENGYDWNKPYRKSARVVGDVIGKYHPHGDQSIYDALVRLAQPFSMRLPLLDGQGNFGSVDGDPAAAMRYTEVRMAKVAHLLVNDLDKETVDFQDNYDGSEREPKVLPAEFPNLLVNGANGIAVGMATNVPPHNLGEVIDACCRASSTILRYFHRRADRKHACPGTGFSHRSHSDAGRVTASRSAYLTGQVARWYRARPRAEVAGNPQARPLRASSSARVPYQVNKATHGRDHRRDCARDKKHRRHRRPARRIRPSTACAWWSRSSVTPNRKSSSTSFTATPRCKPASASNMLAI